MVVCSGLNSAQLLQPLGVRLPLKAVHGYSVSAQIREPLDAPRSAVVDERHQVTIARLAGLIGEHYDREVKVVPGVLAAGSTPRRCPDITKIRALGYEPKIPLAEGLPPVLDWYAAHPQHAEVRDRAA